MAPRELNLLAGISCGFHVGCNPKPEVTLQERPDRPGAVRARSISKTVTELRTQNRYLRPYCRPRPRQHGFRTVRSRCRADCGGRIGGKCRQDSRLVPFIGFQLATLRRAHCAEAVEPSNALSSSGPPILKTFTIHHCTAWAILDISCTACVTSF